MQICICTCSLLTCKCVYVCNSYNMDARALAYLFPDGTYKGDPNCASMDCVDLVLVLGLWLGLILYCKIWRPQAPPYMCPLPIYCTRARSARGL